METKHTFEECRETAILCAAIYGPESYEAIIAKAATETVKLTAERDALAARVAQLEAALTLAQAYVGKGVADGAFKNCAVSGERALEKISAALGGTKQD